MRDKPECDLYENGRCKKITMSGRCNPADINCFSDHFSQCDIDDVCRLASIYGNDLFVLTDENIEALKAGKIIFSVGEYGTFVAYKKEVKTGRA